jgi:hypothetical protein
MVAILKHCDVVLNVPSWRWRKRYIGRNKGSGEGKVQEHVFVQSQSLSEGGDDSHNYFK